MHFNFTPEQREFQQAVRGVLERSCDVASLRASWEHAAGRSSERWQELASLGLVGATVPESHGGLGLGEIDVVLAVEETGRAALPEPLVEISLVAPPLLAELDAAGEFDDAAELLSGIATGERWVTYGAEGQLVADAHVADVVLLERQGALFAGRPEQVSIELQPSMDGARRLALVELDDYATPVAEGPRAAALCGAAFDRAGFGTAAQLLGIAARCIELGVLHARDREQFGRPIGAFQAVKHLLADALVALEFARPAVYRAGCALAAGEQGASVQVSIAKTYASRAAVLAATTSLQVHGAMAYTWEHGLHLWLKRAYALAASWGDADWHRERVARHLLGDRSLQEAGEGGASLDTATRG